MNDAAPAKPTKESSKSSKSAGHGRIYDNIAQTIGNTPLVRLNRIAEEAGAKGRVLLKLEFFNPLASVKDRIGLAMIDALEAAGKITPETTLIEPTSGNTGIALAFVAATRGLRLILVMPESMSLERRKMFHHLGAELVLTPAEKGMRGAVERAEALAKEIGNAVIPGQFDHPANPAIHERTTAEEIWNDTGGEVDIIVSGVGTGGTITGCARALKPRRPELRMIAVEPTTSPVLSGGEPGPHKIQGIGAGFIPVNCDTSLVDYVIQVDNETAFKTARRLARLEGIPAGISTGANVAVALQIAALDGMEGRTIVTFACSFAERYLSTPLFADEEAAKESAANIKTRKGSASAGNGSGAAKAGAAGGGVGGVARARAATSHTAAAAADAGAAAADAGAAAAAKTGGTGTASPAQTTAATSTAAQPAEAPAAPQQSSSAAPAKAPDAAQAAGGSNPRSGIAGAGDAAAGAAEAGDRTAAKANDNTQEVADLQRNDRPSPATTDGGETGEAAGAPASGGTGEGTKGKS